jgi:5-methylcytosine-specific restriction endonuclease McrA
VVDIKKEMGELTGEELRQRIYEKITNNESQVNSTFSKKQLYDIAEEIDIIEGSKCYFCSESESSCLEEHHIIPRSMNGHNSSNNLVVLCASCHRKIEDLYDPVKLNTIVEEIEETNEQYTKPEKVEKADLGFLQ